MIITPPTLWDDQQTWVDDVSNAWELGKNVCGVRPTGTGKTVCLSALARENKRGTMITAHRKELVSQISMSLAKNAVEHRIIASEKTIRSCVQQQLKKLGKSFYNSEADTAASSIDTLIRRGDKLGSFKSHVNRFIVDEGHHLLRDNKWGRGVNLFPNALILGPTATPIRSDGKGLGSHADGFYDTFVFGESMRWYIDEGKLCDYRIYAPPSTIDLSRVDISRQTGDYSQVKLKDAVQQSSIVGDCVSTYIKYAQGKRGVTFVTDGDTGREIAKRFNASGVPALFVDYNCTDTEREDALAQFESGKILQLVNIDLFGEGFDLPAIECVSFCRPTASFSLYVQQFGRVLRTMGGKTLGIVFDHVGNVAKHGLPDTPRRWSLDRRDSRESKSTGIPLRTCLNDGCYQPYPSYKLECPYCGFHHVPEQRDSIEQVDGDLVLLDRDVLDALRKDVEKIDKPVEDYAQDIAQKRVPLLGQKRLIKLHTQRQEQQKILRDAMDVWAGKQQEKGVTREECNKLFFFTFGIDVLSAQGLNSKKVIPLINQIYEDLGRTL